MSTQKRKTALQIEVLALTFLYVLMIAILFYFTRIAVSLFLENCQIAVSDTYHVRHACRNRCNIECMHLSAT